MIIKRFLLNSSRTLGRSAVVLGQYVLKQTICLILHLQDCLLNDVYIVVKFDATELSAVSFQYNTIYIKQNLGTDSSP